MRKSLIQGRIVEVRRFFVFLQYGTSARLAAPLNFILALEVAISLYSRVRASGTLTSLEESSLRRVRFPVSAGKPDGMEQENPSSSGS